MVWLGYLFFVSLCSGLAWLVSARFSCNNVAANRVPKLLFAGLVPTLLLVFALAIWQIIARYQYDRGPIHDGFMGPMVGLIYGFRLVLGNLITNMVFAFWRGRS